VSLYKFSFTPSFFQTLTDRWL